MTDPITSTQAAGSSTTAAAANTGDVVARAGSYYRWTRYIMVLVLIGYGLWSIRDGFFRYPRENAEAKAQGKEVLPHQGLDIPFNRTFGVILPPLGLAYLIYILRKSRGEYRLSGQTLHAPGHSPIPFDSITALDERLWDRKGIAHIDYEFSGRRGRVTLDDFVYERDAIDRIYETIRQYVAPPEPAPVPPGFPIERDETKSPET